MKLLTATKRIWMMALLVMPLTMMAQGTLVDGHYVDPKQGQEANPTNNPDYSLMRGVTVKKAVKGKRHAPIAPAVSYGLPDHVNNGANKYFRNPVANQAGNSCGITSRIAHMMAYELNAYRDKDGSLAENMLPAHFAFVPAYREDPNKENYAKYIGIPDGVTFGGTNVSSIYGGPYSESSNNYGRMQGYENWHKAMFNRITDNPNFPLGAMTEEGALAWKRWLYNHNGDESFHAGGVIGVGVASAGLDAAAIGSTTANNAAGVTGLYYLTHWGTGVDHAMVIVGYDDRIEFDLDGNGTYGETSNKFSQNETGAWIACNSWGNWKNGGFIYVPYALASPTSTSVTSGNYSGYKAGSETGWIGEVYKIRKDYAPIRTLKAAVAYSKRSEIQICVGISTNLNATTPDKTLVLRNHDYHGDYDSNGSDAEVPMLGQWTDGKLHTEAMEFGYDLTDFTDEFNRHVPLKYFLIINTKSGASGTGKIEYASIMDYELNANGIETPFASKNVTITNNGGTTTISTIVYGEEVCGPDNLSLSGTALSWDAPAGSSYTPTEYYVYKDGVRIATTTSRTYDIGSATGVFHVTAGLYSNNGAISESPASNKVLSGMSSSSFITYIGEPITSTSALTSGSYVVLKCTGSRNKYVYDNGSGNPYALTAEAPELLDPDDYKYVFKVGTSGSYYTLQSINGYLPLGNTIDPRASVQTLIVEKVSGSTNLFTFTNSSYNGTYYINGGETNLVVYSLDDNCKFYIYPVHVSVPGTNTLNVTIANPGTVYANAPVQLSLEGAADIASATWNVAGTSYTGVSPLVTFSGTGSKSVSCTATDSKGNSKSVSTTVTVSAAPSLTANFTLSSTSTTGSDRISFLSQNTVPGCTYSWSMPGAEVTTTTTRNASATYTSTGQKTVTLTVTGPDNSSVSHSETFMVNTSAPVSRYSISPAIVVKNNPVTLTDNTLYEPTAWSWRFDSDNNRITCNTQNGTITPTKAGVYKLTFGTCNAEGSDFVEAERALIVCNSESGNGLTFAGGNQNVTATMSSSVSTAWTIDFWFNPSSLGANTQGITGSNTVLSNTRSFTITSDANGVATLSVESQNVSTDAAFYIANEWHHYAITFERDGTLSSSGTVNFYRDGSLVSSKSVSTTSFSNYFKSLQLGGSSAPMSGSIDEFRVWSTALTQANIRSYCVAPIGASTSGLKLYWQLNQNSGNVTDATSNNVTGTRNNFNNDGDAWTDSEGVFALDFSAASNPTISDAQLSHVYDNVYSVTDEQDGNYQRGSIGLAFDGNTSTFYQSRWESGGYSSEAGYPHSFILRRAALHEITAFGIVASSTPTNTLYSGLDASCGRAKYVTIEESDDATNWNYVDKEVRLYDLATNNVILPWPITKEYVRFTFSEPLYTDKVYAALVINEMNFYGMAVEPVKTEVPLTYVACSDESTYESDLKPGSNALDGDESTFWHSSWYGTAVAYPHSITLSNLPNGEIDLFRFYQMHSYSGNQTGEYRAGVMNVETSSDNSTWTTAFEGLRIPCGAEGYVKLPESINASYIRLTFTRNQTSTGNGTFLAMNEIEAYGVEKNVNVVVDVNDVAAFTPDNATDEVNKGSQITSASSLVSGMSYLLYYKGSNNSGFVKAKESTFEALYADNSPTQESVFKFISNGDETPTYKIKSNWRGTYFPVPTKSTTFAPTTESSAGSWALNFQSNGNIAPSCNGYSINRSTLSGTTRVIHGWDSGTAAANQLQIYEVALSSAPLSELTNKIMIVSNEAASTVQTGLWYVMFDRGANHGYLYENSTSHTLYNTNTAPATNSYAPNNAKYLVRIVGENGNYYIQTGFGNYFGEITQSTAVPTTGIKEQLITIKKIDGTDGHYYLQNPSNNVVLDANATNAGDATVVGWNTTVPTTTGGNNDWAFYPVELVESEYSIMSENVEVKQGNQVTGKGNTMQALLRIKATPFSDFQPTQFSINLSGAAQVDNVKVYSTTSDQIRFAGVTPTLLGTTALPADGTVNVSVTANSVDADATMYYWITADVKGTATEWEAIDASLSSITYTNTYKTEHSLAATTLDLSSIGNPDGEMRIYKSQNTLWTSSKGNSKYYRIPALLKIGANTLLAFTDDRYASTSDLGSSHKIDVLVKKSTDGGATWGNAVTVAAGDGSTAAGYGYGDAAVAQAANGDIVCLMAAGNTSYGSGMKHIGFTKSIDGGATWSSPIDIYGNTTYLTNSHEFQSTFVSSGHGITQTIANAGRIAFPALGKISGTTNEYVIYSDDNGATWTFTDNYGYTGADESKLLELNDGKLLMSIRCGSYNSSNVARGYNRTTDTNVENWGTQGTWSDLTANGCNSDIIYYARSTNGGRDVMFHSVVKSYSNGHRKDLRLYMSFDQGETWEEAFKLQPGWAAYSSMQVLDNGDLAILFEDGSIGNEDVNDCYDINYVTISRELLEAKMEELHPTSVEVKIAYDNTAPSTYGSWVVSGSGTWRQGGTSLEASGMAGLTMQSSYSGAFNQAQNIYSKYVLALKVSATNATDQITLTAPDGYVIKSYQLNARSYNNGKNYTLTSGSTSVSTVYNEWRTLSVSDINAKSTSFNVTTAQDQTNYLCISDFTVVLKPDDGEAGEYDILMPTAPADDLLADTWYVMYDRGNYRAYLYENDSQKLYNTFTEPGLISSNAKRYLVRLSDAGDGKYYIETGNGHYWKALAQSTVVSTGDASTKETFTVAKIADTNGHFYVRGSNDVVLDANSSNGGDATVVGYGTTVPTATGGNNDWAFYPVTLVEHFAPTMTDIYTLNNTNSNRGALMSAPSQSEKWVWDSGKNSQTFDATAANCQWIFVSTAPNQYCLYNVGKQKFIVPTKSGGYSGYSWMFSSDAVPLQLYLQSDGTYKMSTVSGNIYISVSNNYTGPIINYNDVGAKFTLTKQADASSEVSAQLNSAVMAVPNGTRPVTFKAVDDKSYATLYLDYDAQTDENTKAYYITEVTNGYAQLTEVANAGRNIPAYTAVLLVNDNADTNASFGSGFSVSNGYTSAIAESGNLLKGTLTGMELDLGSETPYYSLGQMNDRAGFYKFNKNGTTTIALGANKAYLDTTVPSGNVKGFKFDFGDIATEIVNVNDNENGNKAIYNLSGQRVQSSIFNQKKGIYIVNGKKVLVK